MYTIVRAKGAAGAAGEPLPAPFGVLNKAGVFLRRGQFVVFAAAPGVGKSAVSMVLALHSDVPAFYFSADTDPQTMFVRCAANVSGWNMADVENAMMHGNVSTIEAQLDGLDHLRWDFTATLTIDHLEAELRAFAACYGQWPSAVYVDNLSNVFPDEGGDSAHQALDRVCDYLHELARTTNACVIGLHHVTGPNNDGNIPVPLSGVKGQPSRVPEVILTLHRTDDGRIGVSVVKNRGGRADASGQLIYYLDADLARMCITG